MGILRNIFGGGSASPDSVTFDVSRYEYQGVRDGAKVWHTADGYGLGFYFFDKKPDISSGLTSTSQLRDNYSSLLGAKFRVIDCQVQRLDTIPGVRLIVGGLDPESRAAVYVGSFTVPFRDFSYVIKMQAAERGVTGTREALLVNRALRDGTGSIQDGKFVPNGWSFDDEKFDSLLPKHPLSRLREELKLIAGSVRMDEKVKRAAPFDLPQDSN
jgi:hypothetical protein